MNINRQCAFTLIEVLIVVIIMAVLAATIIPQFSTSSRDAKMCNLKFNLRAIRAQLEKYKEQHAGTYPQAVTGADFARQLTEKTDADARFDAARGSCGPYLQGSIPRNSFNDSNSVAILPGAAAPTAPTGSHDGWQYSPISGAFYPNNPEFFQSNGGFAGAD